MKTILLMLLRPFLSMLTKADGWKAIIGYIVTELTAIVAQGNPLVAEAIQKAIQEPSGQNILMAIGQVTLTLGLLHKGVKNVSK